MEAKYKPKHKYKQAHHHTRVGAAELENGKKNVEKNDTKKKNTEEKERRRGGGKIKQYQERERWYRKQRGT